MAGARSSRDSGPRGASRVSSRRGPGLGEMLPGDRQPPAGLEHAGQLGLHLVEHPPPRQGVEPFRRLDLLARLEAMDGRQQELVRTRREALKGGHRVGPRRQPMRVEGRPRPGFRPVDAVVAAPGTRRPARPAGQQRPAQGWLEGQEITRPPPRLGRVLLPQQRSEDREIVLDVVDGLGGILGGRPRQPRLDPLVRPRAR